MENMNLEGYLAKILESLTPENQEQAKRRGAEYVQLELDEWWGKIAPDLPRFPYARWENREWLERCSPRVVEAVKAWRVFELEKDKLRAKHGLLLCAPTGTGKSTAVLARIHRAYTHARKLAGEGKLTVGHPPTIVWITEQRLVQWSWDDNERMQRARDAGLLVVDEVGFAGGDQAVKGRTPAILDIMSARYDRSIPTVVTSGLCVDDLVRRYGVAVVRRMQNCADILDIVKP
jgi:sigma54-dependent transcription regulator